MTPADVRPSLITGNHQMDAEHALQLGLLRELLDSLEAGDRPAALEVFERLEAFAGAHGLAEELLMRLHSYPRYVAHAAEHGLWSVNVGVHVMLRWKSVDIDDLDDFEYAQWLSQRHQATPT